MMTTRAATALLIAGVVIGCAPVPVYPGRCPTLPPVVIPDPPPPATLHALQLESPAGGRGQLLMRKTFSYTRAPRVACDDPGYRTESALTTDGHILVQDKLGEWEFRYTTLALEIGVTALRFRFTNKTAEALQVDWSRTALVAPAGEAMRVIHRGVRMAERSAPVSPSLVPPNAILDEFVFPVDSISFVNEWLATPFFEKIRPGMQIKLFVGLVTTAGTSSKEFAFSATGDIHQ